MGEVITLDFDDFLCEAIKKGFDYTLVIEFYDYFQNLNTIEQNLKDLKKFIKRYYNYQSTI